VSYSFIITISKVKISDLNNYIREMRDMSKHFFDSKPWLNARENKEIFLYKPDESLYHVYENEYR